MVFGGFYKQNNHQVTIFLRGEQDPVGYSYIHLGWLLFEQHKNVFDI